MPAIKGIKLIDFKCDGEVVQEIGPLTLLVGPTGAGKSRFQQGLQFACEGETNLGKKPEASAVLCGPRGGGVAVTLDNGFKWTRSLINDNGRISTKINVAGEGPMDVGPGSAKVHAETGSFAPTWDDRALLGITPEGARNLILRLCAKAVTGDSAVTTDSIKAAILAETLSQHPEIGDVALRVWMTERHKCNVEDASQEQLERAAAHFLSEETHAALHRTLPEVFSQVAGEASEAIAAALSRATDMKNLAKKDHDDGTGAAAELARQQAELPAAAGSMADMKDRLTTLRADKEEAMTALARVREKAAHAATLARAVEEAQARIVEIQAEQATLRDSLINAESASEHDERAVEFEQAADLSKSDAEKAKAKLGAVQESRDAHVSVAEKYRADREQVESLNVELAEAEKALKDAETDDLPDQTEEELTEALCVIESDLDEIKGGMIVALQGKTDAFCEMGRAKAKLSNSADWLKVSAAVEDLSQFADTREVEEGIDEIRAIIKSAIGEDPSSIQKAVDDAEKAHAKAEKAVDELRKKEADLTFEKEAFTKQAFAVEKLNRLQGRADQLVLDRGVITTKWGDATQESLDALVKESAKEIKWLGDTQKAAESGEIGLRQMAKEHRRLAAEVRDKVELQTQQSEKLAEDLAKEEELLCDLDAKQDEVNLGGEQTTEDLEAQIETLAEGSKGAEADVERKQSIESMEANLATTQATALRRGVDHDMAKLVGLAIRSVRERLMSQLTAPLVERMDVFIKAMDPGLKAYVNLENTPGKKRVVFGIGWIRNGRKIPFQALSAGEYVVFTAALRYALVSLGNPPLKVLLIEAGELFDDENKYIQALMAAAEWAVRKGGMNNAIICAHPAEIKTSEAWTVGNIKSPATWVSSDINPDGTWTVGDMRVAAVGV